jgi:hypothetical protein
LLLWLGGFALRLLLLFCLSLLRLPVLLLVWRRWAAWFPGLVQP